MPFGKEVVVITTSAGLILMLSAAVAVKLSASFT
jgi:hypothetical protein